MASVPTLTGIGSLPPVSEATEDALRAAVGRQRAHGFGLVSDGEPRADMLGYYESIPGIEIRARVPRIVGRIAPLEDPASFSKVRDLEALRTMFPELAFKVSLTAPATFLLACAATGAGPAYRGPLDPTLHDDLTEALRPIAREIGKRGAHLQLDDPMLSQGMRDYAPELRRLDAIASEVPRARASLHVCGGLSRSRVLEALPRLESIATLSIAFAGRAERENLGLVDRVPWKDRGLSLSAGVMDVQAVKADEVMSPEAVGGLLREVATKAGEDAVRYVTPDCGLRGTPPDLVDALLTNLQKGHARAFGRR